MKINKKFIIVILANPLKDRMVCVKIGVDFIFLKKARFFL